MNSSNSSFDPRENLVRRIGLVILAVTVAVDLILRQMNLETPTLADTLTVIEFLAVGLLVWVFVSHRRRQKTPPTPTKNRQVQPRNGPNRKKSFPNSAKEPLLASTSA